MARFLLITHIYPPAVDGGSRAIAKMGDYLYSQGHQILVLSSNCTSSDDFVKKSHTTVKHPSSILSLPVFTFLHRPLKFLGRFFPLFKTLAKGPIFSSLPLFKLISFHPDYILAGPLPTTIVLYAKFIRLFTKSKLIICPCFHPNDPDFQNPSLISVLKKADYLWCLTNFEKKYFVNQLKLTSAKYFVHGLGLDQDFLIDPQKIHFPQKINLLFIANFSAHKRAELLIQAFDILLKKHPEASLSLMGQKTLYFPQIEAFLQNFPASFTKKINFVFAPSRDQIKNAIDSASCLILPSIHESFGLVFIESLARGKPVIGADTPQTREVLQHLNGGLTFKRDDPQDLYLKISQLIESPLLSSKLGLQGFHIVKNSYTWNKIGEKLCKKLSL